MKKNTEVLIIGAGPSGLMMACQLSRLGVPFRIVEKNKGPNRQSRALAIHACSMETFSQLGIADQFVSQGRVAKAINYLVKGKVGKHIPLSEFGKGFTPFPYLLILEQFKTEKILVDFLEKQGHEIEWETELITFSQDKEAVHAIIKKSESGEEKITAGWLVGADGAKSIVRHSLNIPFGGETYPIDLFVLDCKVSWPLDESEMYIAYSDYSFAGFFPMPEGRCRVIGFVPEEVAAKGTISFEDVSKDFAERMQMPVKLSDPDWISMYHSHHRYVSNFRIERCFLIGDSAHIHSPVGAQGMNTGLQDAYNLAWKLAFVIQGKAKENLLATFQEERLPFAKQLVKTTDRAFGITVSKNSFLKFARMYVAPKILGIILKIKFVAKFIFMNISQIGISYPDSTLSQNASHGSFPSYVPKPGQRLPYITFKDNSGKDINIQEQVAGTTFHLFIFSGNSKTEDLELLRLINQYKATITFEVISFSASAKNLYRSLGIKKTGFYLVRPDMHIAYRSIDLSTEAFNKYLASLLIH